jgi:3-oxoacyl-(acyl-carrier-protein) synthase
VSGGHDDARRIVITGMGALTPVGETPAELLSSLLAGRSGITRWRNMDGRIDSKIGGDMSGFSALAHFQRRGDEYPAALVDRAGRVLASTPLAGHLAAAASVQAYVDAGLTDGRIRPERIAHVLGGANFNNDYVVENARLLADDPNFIEPLYAVVSQDTDVLAKVSELLCLKGPTWTVGNVCASGNAALLSAVDLLRAGRADSVLVSSTSPGVDPVLLQGLAIMNVISWQSFNDEPWRASRPFDARREGFVPGEGAAAVVLETLAAARARGARIHAEVLGGSSTSDASRLPRPQLDGPVRAMRGALEDAGLPPERVGYINAHAASTRVGDAVEVAAIKAVFGAHAYRIPVNSTKSMIGHCLWASALVELVATVRQMQEETVHSTINLEQPDPELDLDFVPGQARPHCFDVALSNAFGFGGLNSCVVVGRVA